MNYISKGGLTWSPPTPNPSSLPRTGINIQNVWEKPYIVQKKLKNKQQNYYPMRLKNAKRFFHTNTTLVTAVREPAMVREKKRG